MLNTIEHHTPLAQWMLDPVPFRRLAMIPSMTFDRCVAIASTRLVACLASSLHDLSASTKLRTHDAAAICTDSTPLAITLLPLVMSLNDHAYWPRLFVTAVVTGIVAVVPDLLIDPSATV